MQDAVLAQVDVIAERLVAVAADCPRTWLVVQTALVLLAVLGVRLWTAGRKFSLAAMARAVGAGGAIDSAIDAEVNSAVKTLFAPTDESIPVFPTLPKTGMDSTEVLDLMEELRKGDLSGEDGKAFAYVYNARIESHNKTVETAQAMFVHENALNPTGFPALVKFEAEVVSMTASMFGGGTKGAEDVCGTMTSGGTESILMAVKVIREHTRANKPGIVTPEIIAPLTVHPAFNKAAHTLGLKLVMIPVNSESEMKLSDMEKAINANTVALIGSAPSYPHGVLDDIPSIAALAQSRGLLMHVDACIGGFMLPFVRKLGYEGPAFDFTVPGVTSLSADVHKYGYCPKGASVVLYRNYQLRKFQFYAYSGWPGGLFVSPSALGSRSGGPIAAAWASLVSLGEEGLMKIQAKVMDTSVWMQKAINEIPEVEVVGKPAMTIVAFRAKNPKKLNIYAVADTMENTEGWHIERQQLPDTIHMTLMPPHWDMKEKFVACLKKSIAHVLATPATTSEGTAAMYGAVSSIPDGAIVDDFLLAFADKVYRARGNKKSD